MSHKTMIDGVAYEISGGKTLVGGTAYSIKNGKALIGGTAYEVAFEKIVLVTITKNRYASKFNRSNVEINGQVYDGSVDVQIEVPIGTVIKCSVSSNEVDATASKIWLNGTLVLQSSATNLNIVYDHVVDSPTTVALGVSSPFPSPGYGHINIYDDGNSPTT